MPPAPDPALRPTLSERLLAALLPVAERDEVVADLRAERSRRERRDGPAAARLWVWRQVAASVPALVGRTLWRGRTGFESRANRARPGGPRLESWIVDLRFALRRLRRRPLYAALAVGTLALGVGGAAAIAGVVRGLLLEPLPYAHEERLGIFWSVYDWSEREFLTLERDVPGFEEVAIYQPIDVTLERPGGATLFVPGLEASAELFDVLGTPPLRGRGFRAGDDLAGAEPVAVLSYGMWRDLGQDPSIVGRTMTLDGESRTVVGVMPPGFWFPSPDVRVWVSRRLSIDERSGNYAVVGRLADGVGFDALPTHLERTTERLAASFDYPEQWDKTKGAAVAPIRDELVGPLRPALWATAGAMAMILLIACANVAALALGQAEGRSGELASRVALGADRGRLAQQLVAEALLVAAAAAILGAGFAAAGFRLLVTALPLGAWAETARVDGALFATALLAALAASFLVALPALVSLGRGEIADTLRTTRTGGVAARGGRLESTLVVVEVALAVLIAAGTALVARSVANLYAIDPGIDADRVAVVDVVLPGDAGLERRKQLVRELTDALATLPGVERAAASHKLPLRGEGSSSGIAIEGGEREERTTYFRQVTPGYFETMGYPLEAGRTFTRADAVPPPEDGEGEPEVPIVINRALAETFFPGRDPLGRIVSRGFGARERIVGVVGDAAEATLSGGPAPARYWLVETLPFGSGSFSFVLRAKQGVDPLALLQPARDLVNRLAPGAAVAEATTMGRVLDRAVGPARQVVRLLAILAALAVTLGAIGVYGVLAHFVTRRHRDWAIRMALGHAPRNVISHVVARGALLVAAGVGLGWLLALSLARLLRSLLFGVGPTDPLSLLAAGAALLAVGLTAALVPAWRAGRTPPAMLLKET